MTLLKIFYFSYFRVSIFILNFEYNILNIIFFSNTNIPFFFQEIPLIFIGPGTGLAPFRSVIKEKEYQNTANKDTLHLFFGCRYKNKDFHCKEELEKMVDENKLTLYCAFSRDQDDKM